MKIEDIDLSATEFWGQPLNYREEAFDLLRTQDPYRYFEIPEEITEMFPQKGFHSLVRHSDVAEASRRSEDFCSGQGATSVVDLKGIELFGEDMNSFFGSMISMDDPRHQKLRKIVSSGFTPRRLTAVEDSVQRIAEEIIQKVGDQGECDFVVDVASRLPLLVICEMMGVPESQVDLVFDKSNVILGAGDDEYLPEGQDVLGAIMGAALELTALMNEMLEERQDNPKDDLASALLHAEVDGEQLTNMEIASFFILLLVAGNETTRNALSWGLHLLTENPDQKEALWNDFETLAPKAAEEIVRWSSPVIYMRRTATRDGVRIGEREFSEGDKVALYYWAANRDPNIFENPHKFDIFRESKEHFGYGAPGPHFCLGAHLARREITVMLREICKSIPDIHATHQPDRLLSNFINGIKHLPCSFKPVKI